MSTALTRYAAALSQQTDGSRMIYEHEVLQPIVPSGFTVMRAAAAAPSLLEYVQQMALDAPALWRARRDGGPAILGAAARARSRATLQRLRAIPSLPHRATSSSMRPAPGSGCTRTGSRSIR